MNPKQKLKACEQKQAEIADQVEAIWRNAEKEGREATDEERLEAAELVKSLRTLKEQKRELEEEIELRKSVHDLAGKIGADENPAPRVKPGGDQVDRVAKSIGEMFTESPQFKAIQDPSSRPQQFHTGPVELSAKGTLLTTAGGGGLPLANLVPQVVPGVVDKLFQRLTVADLILSGQATAQQITYAVQGTATSAAAGVAEGGTKPESTLGFTSRTDPVKKIAHVIVTSDEMLEDAAQVQSFINGQMSLFVDIEEERQLLRGAGTNEIVGIMDSTRGINVYAGGTAAGNKAVQLFKAMNGQRGSALLEPDWILINPTDWEAIRLLTDTAGQYFGGGPFQGPYGNGRNFDASNIVSGADEFLWNKPVVVTSALGSGTALIGTQVAAQRFVKGGITVEATNSHSDYFVKDLVAIRAEKREALAVYRPTAFTDVRLA
jgi:HK97 family phage major capsid protein